jgi:hypothetical protein
MATPTFFSEGNTPRPKDTVQVSLEKCLGALLDNGLPGAGGGGVIDVPGVPQEDFEAYSDATNIVGSAVLIRGIGWHGAGDVVAEIPNDIFENFDSYADTTGVAASTLTGGYGWSGAPAII